MFARRLDEFRGRLADAGFDIALITDDDSVYYYTGYYDYLHMEFGRPTILVVRTNGESLLITPSMELDMAEAAAALGLLRPGITAEEIHAAYAEIIHAAGFDYPFRYGRATGFSFLEQPQLVYGDKTVLQPGMVLAVDGSVSVAKTFRAQVGDSFIVTEDGYEQLTAHPKALEDVIV